MRVFIAAVVFGTATLGLAVAVERISDVRASLTGDRGSDPVVLTGAQAGALAGIAPGDLVAFKYDGGWQQMPVQVDERAMKDFGAIYGTTPNGISVLQYTDPGTFTGADANAMLDADDEIAFMARDGGDVAGTPFEPAGTIDGSGVQVEITDSLAPGTSAYVYLFEQDGSLDSGAGQQYVTYTFDLLSGPYATTYRTVDGPNPEDSTIVSPYYARHFGDRWLDDELQITVGGSTGADILDRHKALFAPGVCVRSEDTFDDAEGAFVVNKSGPVRAIRSYVGANSGPLTQREHIFYEQRQDVRTFLRVHAISSVMDFYDYGPAATGMTYYNDFNLGGVMIDGAPETPAAALGPITWELATGAQGSVVMAGIYSQNITGFAYTSYYLDDSTPPVTQCTGDAAAYGSSGAYVNQAIPNTDPSLGATNFLNTQRIIYYRAPGVLPSEAAALSTVARTPLTVATAAWNPGVDSDGDGLDDVSDNCPAIANASQADGDTDDLGDACEASYGTHPGDADSDDDSCRDGREVRVLSFAPSLGGDRDPLNTWDFFDVTGDRVVDLQDTLNVLAYFGDPGVSSAANLRDRSAPNNAKPWRSAEANNGVDLIDALANLRSFGSTCLVPV